MSPELLISVALAMGLSIALPTLRSFDVHARRLLLVLLQLFVIRYMAWRAMRTLAAPAWSLESAWQWSFFIVELLGTVYICWSAFVLMRHTNHTKFVDCRVAELRSRAIWPRVSVLIPTMNEPLEVLERTIRAALAMNYKNFDIWICDDEKEPKQPRVSWLRRWLHRLLPEFVSLPEKPVRMHGGLKKMCERYGVNYLWRSTSHGFKAGNLNNALAHAKGEILLVLDADFEASRDLLLRLMAMLDDETGLVQSPQHFYGTDPLQHAYQGDGLFGEEQRHFFDVVLPARDGWNNALCVGTSFIVRRESLPDGLFPLALSEDVYLGYAVLSRGYRVRYLNEPLSFGAAADSLPEFLRQRIRWSSGCCTLLWLPHGPLRARGLRLIDRLFYLDLPLYWLATYSFLAMMLLAPAIYFWTGVPVFHSSLDEAIAYVLPRIIVPSMVMFWISEGRVMPVVSELRNMVGVWYILAAIGALVINPRGKPFVPTLKGEKRDRVVVNWEILWPFAVLGVVTAAGLARAALTDAAAVVVNEHWPLNVALGVYMLAILFFTCVACVDLPKDTMARNYNETLRGRWLASMATVVWGRWANTRHRRDR